jgi:hypothetical protein
MGWCSATDIMDAALEGAERAVTAAWQIASGQEGARTPAFANALNEDPSLRAKLDDVLRPFVVTIAAKLRDGDWDCVDESRYYDRFPQEMHGWTDERYAEHLAEMIADDPLNAGVYTTKLHALQTKGQG